MTFSSNKFTDTRGVVGGNVGSPIGTSDHCCVTAINDPFSAKPYIIITIRKAPSLSPVAETRKKIFFIGITLATKLFFFFFFFFFFFLSKIEFFPRTMKI